MKNLILVLVFGMLFLSSCKKETPKPETIYVTQYSTVTDTVVHSDTTTVHDTTYITITPLTLQGIWNCYKLETYTGGSLSSTSPHSDWVFTFGSTTLTQNLGASGVYNYPINYNTGSVDIFFTSTPTNYFVTPTNNGTEYKLIKYPGTGSYQIWYFSK